MAEGQRFRRSTPEDEDRVRNWRDQPERRLVGSVAAIGKDGIPEFEPLIVELLDHESWSVRSASIYALLYSMDRPDYFPRAVEIFLTDDDAAFEVGMMLSLWVKVRAPERFSEVMEHFLRRMLTAGAPRFQLGVYTAAESMLELVEPKRGVTSSLPFDLRSDVDWDIFAKWVPPDLEVPEGVLSTREVSSPEDLEVIQSRETSTDEKIAAMERLLLDRRQEARGSIERLYRAKDPRLAAAALRSYSQTWGTVLQPAAVGLLMRSEHEDVRVAAAEALAAQDRTLGIGFSYPTATLLEALRKDESAKVKTVAYRAVLAVVAPGSEVPDAFDPDHDIDWDLIKRAIPEDAHYLLE